MRGILIQVIYQGVFSGDGEKPKQDAGGISKNLSLLESSFLLILLEHKLYGKMNPALKQGNGHFMVVSLAPECPWLLGDT